MSLYQGFAQQKGFNPVDIPDPAEKIRQQGLETMRGMEAQINHNSQQAETLLRAFSENANIEESQRAQNFQDQQDYAQVLAKQKWRNYETAVRNAEIRQKRKQKDWDALLNLTKSGASLVKQGIDHNRKVTDRFVQDLQLHYNIGEQNYNRIKGLSDQVLNDNTKLQGLLREWEVRGDVPMDVIARIRRGGGYMNIAVNKLAAQRWARNDLPGKIAARSNEILDLPGMGPAFSLNTAKGPNVSVAYDYLVSDELSKLTNEDGSRRFSAKTLSLAGVSGPNGFIARGKSSYVQRDVEKTANDEYADRNREALVIIQDMIGPQGGVMDVAGPKGVLAATYYFAGGPDASGQKLAIGRDRVVDALDYGLRSGLVTWDQVKGLEHLEIYPKGVNGQKTTWGKHFKPQWLQLEAAGNQYYKNEEASLALDTAHLKIEGDEHYNNMVQLYTEGNEGDRSVKNLQRHLDYAKHRGPHFEKSRTYLGKLITQGKTTINDQQGTRVLLARAEAGEVITPQEIDNWNFSDSVKAEVEKRVRKHNQDLPQLGENGTKERLENFIDGELKTIIPPKSGYQHNSTHKDAKIGAMRTASKHYRTAREAGKSHEDAYDYAKGKISEELNNPNGRWGRKVDSRGVAFFNDFGPKRFDQITLTRDEIGTTLSRNPDAIYTQPFIPSNELKEISAQAHKGRYKPVHRTAMLIQSLTGGQITGVDAMQAQLQMIRDREIKESGAATTQLLPVEYVKRFNKESQKLSPLGHKLLNTYNLVDVNKAYVNSGYQPPNQDPYYKKVDTYVGTGDYNHITRDGLLVNSKKALKFDITNHSVREVLMMMENGHFTHAGSAQFDYDGLKEATDKTEIGWEAKFNEKNQRKLQNWRFKTYGVAGFPHVQDDGYNHGILNEVHGQLNTDKIDNKTYYRSMASCNSKACAFMRDNAQLFGLEQ